MKKLFIFVLLFIFSEASAETKYEFITDNFFENNNFLSLNNKLFFISQETPHGREIWQTDGTTKGTLLSLDINFGSPSSDPELLFTLNNKIFFNAYDYVYGKMLWVSDGTNKGSLPLINIEPNHNYATFGDTVFFTANHYLDGNVLWKSDATKEGTKLFKNVDVIAPLQSLTDKLYFLSNNHNGSYSLWVSNGYEDGTSIVNTIHSDISTNLDINDFVVSGELLYFSILTTANMHELWVSNGSNDGTELMKKLQITSKLHAIKSKIYFMADQSYSQKGLWVSDGTAEGTKLIKKLSATVNGDIATANEQLYFKSFDFSYGHELWTSDGTQNGTSLVKRFDAIRPLYTVANQIYFFADDGIYGMELWTSDGSYDGTYMIEDYSPGQADSNINILTTVNNSMYVSIEKNNEETLWHMIPFVNESIETKVYNEIANKSYKINGTFASYDFAESEEIFDWVFTDVNGLHWQLQGDKVSKNSIFGWKNVDIATTHPKWYMIQLDSDIDEDGSMKFDWLLISTDETNKSVYKLMGATADGQFSYSKLIIIDYALSNDTKSILFK